MIGRLSLACPYHHRSYFWQVSVEQPSQYHLSAEPYVGSAWGVKILLPPIPQASRSAPEDSKVKSAMGRAFHFRWTPAHNKQGYVCQF